MVLKELLAEDGVCGVEGLSLVGDGLYSLWFLAFGGLFLGVANGAVAGLYDDEAPLVVADADADVWFEHTTYLSY